MTEQELKRRLTKLNGDIPLPVHAAYTAAVRNGKEEKTMKSRLRLTPILVIVLLLLLAVTAYAVVSRFSVTDYAAQGKPTEAFLRHVVAVDQTYENPYMTMTANDVIYDGTTLTMAFDFTPKDRNMHLFLHPRLTAQADGRGYEADVEGFGAGDFMSGFVYPFFDGHDATRDGYGFGFDAVLLDEADEPLRPAGDVEWTLTINVYKPLYQVEYYNLELDGSETEEQYAQKMQVFQQAYQNGTILVTNDASIAEWEACLPMPEGISPEAWMEMPWWDHLPLSGAYELMDVVEVRFTTPAPEKSVCLTEAEQQLSALPITVDEVNTTLMELSYRLHYELTGETEELSLGEVLASLEKRRLPMRWALTTDDGRPCAALETSEGYYVNDGSVFYYMSGRCELPGGIPKAVTFVQADENGEAVAGGERFTVTPADGGAGSKEAGTLPDQSAALVRIAMPGDAALVLESATWEQQLGNGKQGKALTLAMHYELPDDAAWQTEDATAGNERLQTAGLPQRFAAMTEGERLRTIEQKLDVGQRNGMLRSTLSLTVQLPDGLPDRVSLIPCDENEILSEKGRLMIPLGERSLGTGRGTLRPGDQGNGVATLQLLLMKRGLLQTANGSYDDATCQAVKELQKQAGLVPDGVAGPMTQKALQTNE